MSELCSQKSPSNELFSILDFSMITCEEVRRKFEFLITKLFKILQSFRFKIPFSDFKKTELLKELELMLKLNRTVSEAPLTQIKNSCSIFERIKFSIFVLDIIKT